MRSSALLLAAVCFAASCGSVNLGSAGEPEVSVAAPGTTAPAVSGSTTTATASAQPTTSSSSSTDSSTSVSESTAAEPQGAAVRTGAGILIDEDFRSLASDRLGLIVNQTSVVDGQHLIDLVAESPVVDLGAVFAPEHGVRGSADAGEAVGDSIDQNTGAPIYSLYGSTRAPTAAMLSDVDVLVYDLQDVGTRFYTYISTMGLAMQAAAAADIPFVVLDRPNPLGGDLVAGFTRTDNQESFVSQYPVPSVYGLTAGELALAIVGESWLPGLADLDLRIIRLEGWERSMRWESTGLEWIAPSPGLPTSESALVYPGTVLFETTTLSYGKGTEYPFTAIGANWVRPEPMANNLNDLALPGVLFEAVTFTPDPAIAPNPRHANKELYGLRILVTDADTFEPMVTGMHVLTAFRTEAIVSSEATIVDRRPMFSLLAGTAEFLRLFDAGATAKEIIAAWADDVVAFETLRQPYLLYPED